MDLKPIYEFRTRLYAVAMAGTQFMMEDYRLKCAIEELQPLEQFSPVFARMIALGKQLISSDCDNKEGTLLDVITLTDAILCTQGVVEVSGNLEEIEYIVEYKEEGAIQTIPYSTLHDLMKALTGVGGGRYGILNSLHTAHPDYFEDYRIKTAMVEALSDTYTDLGNVIERWIKESGISFIPFLKRGFLNKDSITAVKIVQLIEEFCKEKENEFYLEKLSESEEFVRGALILALRHSKENAEVLLHLAKTEKGTRKKMAYWALAEMEGEEVEAFWDDFYKKKPKDAIQYLSCSKTSVASRIVAKEFYQLITPWITQNTPNKLTNEMIQTIDNTAWALQGKTGLEVCECYRKVMQISGLLAECKKFWQEYTYYSTQGNKTKGTKKEKELCYRMAEILHKTLLQCQDKPLGELAMELYETYGELYFEAAATAKLLEDKDGTALDWLIQQLKEEKVSKEIFVKALECTEWDEKEQSYILKISTIHKADNRRWEVKTPILASLNEETFIQFLMEQFSFLVHFTQEQVPYAMDVVMSQWIRAEDTKFCETLEQYYYKKALDDGSLTNSYVDLLKKCYAKECKGLAVKHFKGRGISWWEVEEYFKYMPGTVENKEKEARAIYDMILNKEITLHYKESVEYLQQMKESRIQEWANS